jgi:MtN3 and saliva related transmembrane protein
MLRFNRGLVAVFVLTCTLPGCQKMIPQDTTSLLIPRFQRSEIFGLVAGFGTTFAALPDLVVMLRRKSSKGMNPRMATITGIFQILWVYYGLLILSRPVVFWNLIAVLINSLSVASYCFFRKKDMQTNAMN